MGSGTCHSLGLGPLPPIFCDRLPLLSGSQLQRPSLLGACRAPSHAAALLCQFGIIHSFAHVHLHWPEHAVRTRTVSGSGFSALAWSAHAWWGQPSPSERACPAERHVLVPLSVPGWVRRTAPPHSPIPAGGNRLGGEAMVDSCCAGRRLEEAPPGSGCGGAAESEGRWERDKGERVLEGCGPRRNSPHRQLAIEMPFKESVDNPRYRVAAHSRRARWLQLARVHRQSPGGPGRGLCWVGASAPPLSSPVALGPSASALS